MDALLVLVSMSGACWWAWSTTAKIARLKSWGTSARIVACSAAGVLSALGAFCISGGLLLSDLTNTGSIVATLGLLLLAPLTFVLWRGSVISSQLKNAANTDAAPRQEEAISTPAETAPQPVVSSFNAPPLPREFFFSYTDHEGLSSRHKVRVMGIASNDGRQYLDGYCRVRVLTARLRLLAEIIACALTELVLKRNYL